MATVVLRSVSDLETVVGDCAIEIAQLAGIGVELDRQ
jgi:hypothetical protein